MVDLAVFAPGPFLFDRDSSNSRFTVGIEGLLLFTAVEARQPEADDLSGVAVAGPSEQAACIDA